MAKRDKAPTFLEAMANELLAKYRKLDTIVTHAPTKGSYHEKILRDIIRDYLPNTYSTGEGFIINADSVTSSQLDVLVVDNIDPRSFGYKENDFYIASDIAACSIGEVKTYCKKKEFKESFHKVVEAKKVIKKYPAICTSFIFCYDAYASADTFRKWVDESLGEIPQDGETMQWHLPDYIFCYKKGVFLERKEIKGGITYVAAIQKEKSKNVIQQMMLQNLFQCVTDGCGRMRHLQGIQMQDEPTPDWM